MDFQDQDIQKLLCTLSDATIAKLLCYILGRVDISYIQSHPVVSQALEDTFTRLPSEVRRNAPVQVYEVQNAVLLEESPESENPRAPSQQANSPSSPASNRTANFASSAVASNPRNSHDSTLTSLTQPSCRPSGKLNIERLLRIIQFLEDVPPNIESLWESTNFLQQGIPEDDPTKRYQTLNAALAKVKKEKVLAVYRCRILNTLIGNERDILRNEYQKETYYTVEEKLNSYMTGTLNISLRTLKSLGTLFKRYTSMMSMFGPGCIDLIGTNPTHYTE